MLAVDTRRERRNAEPLRVAVFKAKEVTGYGFASPETFIEDCPPEKILQPGDVASHRLGSEQSEELTYIKTTWDMEADTSWPVSTTTSR